MGFEMRWLPRLELPDARWSRSGGGWLFPGHKLPNPTWIGYGLSWFPGEALPDAREHGACNACCKCRNTEFGARKNAHEPEQECKCYPNDTPFPGKDGWPAGRWG